MNYKRRGRLAGPTWILIGLVSFSVAAQEHSDPVLDAVVQVGATAGRLLPAAIHGAELGETSPVRTVSVGSVTHDNTVPRIAAMLKSVAEEELLSVARSLPNGGSIAVVADGGETDLTARIRSTSGTQRVLFSIQMINREGRIVASSRVDVASDPALLDALRPGATAAEWTDGNDDTADTPTAAHIIEPGETLANRSLERNGDADWYALTVLDVPPLTPNDALGLRIYTTGSTDTFLEVFGPDSPDVFIAENDDSEDSNAAVTIPVIVGGEYWVKVRGFADSATGGYGLTTELIEIVRDAAEPNDERSEATELSENAFPFVASIRPGGDIDWYYLPAELIEPRDPEDTAGTGGASDTARQQVVQTVATTSVLDTTLTLYDEAGTQIGYNDDGGEGGNARIVLPDTAVRNGNGVYIEVRGFGSYIEGDYTLRIGTETLTFDQYEPDDTSAGAARIEWNAAPQRRTFSSSSDVDWIQIEVPPAESQRSITVETYGDVDTVMTLYTRDEVEMTSDDDGGYGVNARIEEDLAPGQYYITISPLFLDGMDAEYSVEARTR